METLEVSDEQYLFIQRLREAIADQVVGDYGYVRERDAIQFLIDNLDGSVSFDGKFEIETGEDGTSIKYDESAAVEGDDEKGPESASEADSDPESEPQSESESESETEGTVILDEETDDDGDSENATDDGAADDDDMLDEMMSLLETHDDKWDESAKADYRYQVELPDGTSEHVQTKDDVRALLFKNYR